MTAMSENDVLLTGTNTSYDLPGLLILAGLYGAVVVFNVLKLRQALPAGSNYRPVQVLLCLAFSTLLLRLMWILYCAVTKEQQVGTFLGVAPHVVIDGLGSGLCFTW
jgi:hypothetical protein